MPSRLLRGLAACAALVTLPAQADLVTVLNSLDATVSLIDRATRTEIRRVAVGK